MLTGTGKSPIDKILPASCDRASRSEDSATANRILGMLASFSAVFVVKLAASGLSYRQRGFVQSFLRLLRSQFLIYCKFGVNVDRLLGEKHMEATDQERIINLTIHYTNGKEQHFEFIPPEVRVSCRVFQVYEVGKNAFAVSLRQG